jgi:hypothetical protein
MVSQEWKKRWGVLRIWARDYTLHFSAAALALGLVLFIVGAMSFFFQSALPEDWITSLQTGGRYDICAGAVGLMLVIFAGYYCVDNVYKRRKFARLFGTVSREKFVRNRDKIEELAFELSTKHERMVQKKIKEMKIR